MAKVQVPTPDQLTGMFQASGLKEKLIFTLLIIAVFRFGTHIPIFGIDMEAFTNLLKSGSEGANNVVQFLDLFTGGALGKVSIFALGIGPYITSSIIMQLLASVIPHLESLQKEEGEAGRRKISQYTRIFTVALSLFQAIAFTVFLSKNPAVIMSDVNHTLFYAGAVLSLTAGSVFIMWLAELATEKGIGNGGSLLIFVGIISRMPYYIQQTYELVAKGAGNPFALLFLLAIFFATMVMIVVMQDAIRKVVIVNARRQVGNKVYGGVSTHIPFKLNPGGVMPIIFAVAILIFPTTLLGILSQAKIASGPVSSIINFLSTEVINPAKLPYYFIYFLLIIALTFFYSSIVPSMQPKEIANNLKKYGSSIPGIKPGKPTADVLDKILSRTTFIGAMGLGIIALIPGVASHLTGITTLQGIGATSLIIMVGVALDFINQIKTHLLARQYEGFLKE